MNTYEKYGPYGVIASALLFLIADFIDKQFTIFTAFFILMLLAGVIILIYNLKR